jgi:hypothetical protein
MEADQLSGVPRHWRERRHIDIESELKGRATQSTLGGALQHCAARDSPAFTAAPVTINVIINLDS